MLNPSLIVSIVRKGWGNTVLEASVKAGATGGTVLLGRGAGVNEKESIFGIPIEPEKEIILTLVQENEIDAILQEIVRAAELDQPGHGLAFVMPVKKVLGIPHMND
ncbi:Nitrogen regulatory protein P-II [Nitrobacter sp. Nb-311A]|uniref:P-II family nitrogen regulator n=1 Tax=unclassified Nitrobacter TaxID=2620411 RepID=UPI000068659C|nr:MULTISPECIES: P-II family nitrogen regulator [unclassified Nitrobacter]EAQ36012.1 Nitrogen regulatory protein P-II [Nitrobacter sp. Nb-311A]MCB1393347.1 P-II family nitrogen regulator [Nitrobacter sp.]MCV0385833.1 P-II family nitrogen regulator [Nitrobacter sp.]